MTLQWKWLLLLCSSVYGGDAACYETCADVSRYSWLCTCVSECPVGLVVVDNTCVPGENLGESPGPFTLAGSGLQSGLFPRRTVDVLLLADSSRIAAFGIQWTVYCAASGAECAEAQVTQSHLPTISLWRSSTDYGLIVEVALLSPSGVRFTKKIKLNTAQPKPAYTLTANPQSGLGITAVFEIKLGGWSGQWELFCYQKDSVDWVIYALSKTPVAGVSFPNIKGGVDCVARTCDVTSCSLSAVKVQVSASSAGVSDVSSATPGALLASLSSDQWTAEQWKAARAIAYTATQRTLQSVGSSARSRSLQFIDLALMAEMLDTAVLPDVLGLLQTDFTIEVEILTLQLRGLAHMDTEIRTRSVNSTERTLTVARQSCRTQTLETTNELLSALQVGKDFMLADWDVAIAAKSMYVYATPMLELQTPLVTLNVDLQSMSNYAKLAAALVCLRSDERANSTFYFFTQTCTVQFRQEGAVELPYNLTFELSTSHSVFCVLSDSAWLIDACSTVQFPDSVQCLCNSPGSVAVASLSADCVERVEHPSISAEVRSTQAEPRVLSVLLALTVLFCISMWQARRASHKLFRPKDARDLTRDDQLPQVKEEAEEKVQEPQPPPCTCTEITVISEEPEEEGICRQFAVRDMQRAHILMSFAFPSLEFPYEARTLVCFYCVLQELALPCVYFLPQLLSSYKVLCSGEVSVAWAATSSASMVLGNLFCSVCASFILCAGLRSKRRACVYALTTALSAVLLAAYIVIGSNLWRRGFLRQWVTVVLVSVLVDWGLVESAGAAGRVLLAKYARRRPLLACARYCLIVKTV